MWMPFCIESLSHKPASQVGAGLLALGPAVAHAGWVGIRALKGTRP